MNAINEIGETLNKILPLIVLLSLSFISSRRIFRLYKIPYFLQDIPKILKWLIVLSPIVLFLLSLFSPLFAIFLLYAMYLGFVAYLIISGRNAYWDEFTFIRVAFGSVILAGLYYIFLNELAYPLINASLFRRVSSILSYFGASLAYFGWPWTIFGLWLAMRRSTGPRAKDYDQVLIDVANILEKWIRISRDQNRDFDSFPNRKSVRLICFTPSHGNISADKIQSYLHYRNRLIEAVTEQRLDFKIVCLSKQGILDFYRSYFNKVRSKTLRDQEEIITSFISAAATDALILRQQILAAQTNLGVQMIQIDQLSELPSYHLLVTPEEALVWIPHTTEDSIGREVDVKFKLTLSEETIENKYRHSETEIKDFFQSELNNIVQILTNFKFKIKENIFGTRCVALTVKDPEIISAFIDWHFGGSGEMIQLPKHALKKLERIREIMQRS